MGPQEVKPSGTQADETAVAALQALRFTAPTFESISALWPACLLQRESVFQRKTDGAYFVSVGFQKYCSLGWQLAEYPFLHTPTDMSMEDARDRLQFLHCTFVAGVGVVEGDNKEEFAGVPVKICCL